MITVLCNREILYKEMPHFLFKENNERIRSGLIKYDKATYFSGSSFFAVLV